ncbi:MAG TPA: 4-hydroxyphenylacetate 3-hydroxylase, partial [Lysinibacillus sp.]|nr:4-hydroxyphenylacetate 3-hydroxylase [Lysinibacillus sp.]
LMMPTEADFLNPELRPSIDRHYGGREGVDAELRMKIFKLAWDLCGEGFGMRALQYERYYTGDPIRKRAIYYNKFKKRYSFDLVESILAKEDVGEKQTV